MELKRPWEYFFPFPVKELFEKRKERKKKRMSTTCWEVKLPWRGGH